MKKIFLTLALASAIVSCSKDTTLEVAEKSPIAFGNTFVENSTKAIDATITTTTLDQFMVYGSVSGTGSGEGTVNIFNGINVTKTTKQAASTGAVIVDDWWYEGAYTQYWIAGNNYKFAAVVNADNMTFDTDANNKNNMPTTITYDASTQKDLLYAEDIKNNYQTTDGSVVEFTFDHLLSKVHFTFTNTITSNTDERMYTYLVEDIKITNAYKKGVYTIANKNATPWIVTTGTNTGYVVEFGNITNADDNNDSANAILVGAERGVASATSHKSMLLIPNDYQDLNFTFTIKTVLNNVVINTETISKSVDVELLPGKAYNFSISKGAPGEVIKFKLDQVNTWTPDPAQNVPAGTL